MNRILLTLSVLTALQVTSAGAQDTVNPAAITARPMEFKLTRLRDGVFVAIVRVEANGRAALDPRGCGDSPVPAFRDITPTAAEHLWGDSLDERPPAHADEGTFKRTYDLLPENGDTKSQFFIDAVFKDGLLQRYRIRSWELQPSWSWQVVNESAKDQKLRPVSECDFKTCAIPKDESSNWAGPDYYDGRDKLSTRCISGTPERVAMPYIVAPINNPQRFVAIVTGAPSAGWTLNPDGFDYGAIPAVNALTPLQADLLFGPTINAPDGGHTRKYELISKDKKIAFTLELDFEREILRDYRISCQGVCRKRPPSDQ